MCGTTQQDAPDDYNYITDAVRSGSVLGSKGMKQSVFLASLVLFSPAANSFPDESQTQPTGDTSSIHFIQADVVLANGVCRNPAFSNSLTSASTRY